MAKSFRVDEFDKPTGIKLLSTGFTDKDIALAYARARRKEQNKSIILSEIVGKDSITIWTDKSI